jgi:hypothetical protein
MAEQESMFKRGEVDFKTVLNKQLDRILEKLTEGDFDKFSNGVEGLYLILYYYLENDNQFKTDDATVMKGIENNLNDIVKDLRIQPEEKNIRSGELGIQSSKMRLALIDRVLGKRRLLLESRRAWDEREPGTTSTEPTEAELKGIVDTSTPEEQD